MNAPMTLVDPRGVLWHRAEPTRDGEALYVIAGVDPATAYSWAMSTRTELTNLFGAPIREAVDAPIGAAA